MALETHPAMTAPMMHPNSALDTVQPDKLRYAVFDFEDGTFVHYATVPADAEANPLQQLASFQRFQADNGARRIAPPSVMTPRVVGNYRTLLGVPDSFGGK